MAEIMHPVTTDLVHSLVTEYVARSAPHQVSPAPVVSLGFVISVLSAGIICTPLPSTMMAPHCPNVIANLLDLRVRIAEASSVAPDSINAS